MTENEKSDRVKEVDEVLKDVDQISKDRERIMELEEEVEVLKDKLRFSEDEVKSLEHDINFAEEVHDRQSSTIKHLVKSSFRPDNLYDQQKVDLLKELSYNLTLEQLQNFVGIAKSSKTGTWKTQ